ncbi:MAG: hypothetical protein LV481_06640 [Methylacidiphilales bacterium]|nr:hypothetical protein [Candidatus Methylacidiphilales bacterium]
MKLLLHAILLGLTCWLPLLADNLKPVVDGPEGQRAFTDLAAIYAKGPSATFEAPMELTDLNGSDAEKAQNAGAYILALFDQSWADETNGRAAWRALPFWGGGSDNPARTYRGQLADAFGKSASSLAALPAALWLIEHDLVEDNIGSGGQVLSRIHGADADAAIGTILQEQHPSQQVLIMALNEAAARHLLKDKNSVVALEQSYRSAVRDAAQKAALQLGEPHTQEYDRSAPFSPRMVEFLKTNSERLLTPVPEKATWQQEEAGSSEQLQGWMLEQSSFTFSMLDWFAQEHHFLKYFNHCRPSSLQTAAEDLIARRAEIVALQASAKDNEGDSQKAREKLGTLSRYGTLSSQFEPGFISLPEITAAIWCWQRGDLYHCRRILDACYSSADDDRWLDLAARDYLGNIYHQEMVEEFCDDEDDATTLRLANHLSKPIFDGYNYQDRAKELAAQLTHKDNQNDVSLPSLPVWSVLQFFLTRDQQITYLAKRLKLLHTEQDMQPGDVYYDSSMPYNLTAIYCINPYLELKRMGLVNHDFVALAPFTADRDYMRTYSYFRDFHPSRNLHRVCWAVQKLVNETAIPPAPPQTFDQVINQTMKELNGAVMPKNEILSRASDGSVYFTAKPDGDVVQEFRSWAQAQPARGFWASWWQTPTALLISFLILRGYLKRHLFNKLPLKSLIFIFFLISVMTSIFYPYFGKPAFLNDLSDLTNEVAKIFCWVFVVRIALRIYRALQPIVSPLIGKTRQA